MMVKIRIENSETIELEVDNGSVVDILSDGGRITGLSVRKSKGKHSELRTIAVGAGGGGRPSPTGGSSCGAGGSQNQYVDLGFFKYRVPEEALAKKPNGFTFFSIQSNSQNRVKPIQLDK